MWRRDNFKILKFLFRACSGIYIFVHFSVKKVIRKSNTVCWNLLWCICLKIENKCYANIFTTLVNWLFIFLLHFCSVENWDCCPVLNLHKFDVNSPLQICNLMITHFKCFDFLLIWIGRAGVNDPLAGIQFETGLYVKNILVISWSFITEVK